MRNGSEMLFINQAEIAWGCRFKRPPREIAVTHAESGESCATEVSLNDTVADARAAILADPRCAAVVTLRRSPHSECTSNE